MSHLFRRPLSRALVPAALVSSVAVGLYFGDASQSKKIVGDSTKDDDSIYGQLFHSIATTTQCLASRKNLSETKTSTANTHIREAEERPYLLFLGTGSSTGCPKPACAMDFHKDLQRGDTSSQKRQPDPTSCSTSFRALDGGDPKNNRDYRNNPSLLIHHYDEYSKRYKNIVIDVGKTFRETALRWFPIHRIESLDAIILTHHHMDAAAGLDDVRGFQGIQWVGNEKKRLSIPLYLSSFCHLNLRSQFPWLLPKKTGPVSMPQQAAGRPTVKRDVASFDVTIFKDFQKQTIPLVPGANDGDIGGFDFVPLPVWHGDDLISHGFAFSLDPGPSCQKRSLNVVYLSDISRMVPETLEYIQTKLPPTDILIVDSLLWDKEHPVHFSMKQAVQLSRILKPKMRTYLIGMSCDNFLPHDEMNEYLRTTYGDRDGVGIIAMPHDGLAVELPDKTN